MKVGKRICILLIINSIVQDNLLQKKLNEFAVFL